jgi:DNA-binding XRE family transcriptional regulator
MPHVFDGRALRDQRRLAGVPASALAARVNRTTWALWAWERGDTDPPLGVALQLARELHVPLDTLLADGQPVRRRAEAVAA